MPKPTAVLGYNQTQKSGLYQPTQNNLTFSTQQWIDNFTSIDNSLGSTDNGLGWGDDFVGGNATFASASEGFIQNSGAYSSATSTLPEWKQTIVGTGSITLQSLANGIIQLSTGGTSGGSAQIDFGGNLCILPQANVVMGFSLFTNSGANNNCIINAGLYDGTENNKIEVNYTSAGSSSSYTLKSNSTSLNSPGSTSLVTTLTAQLNTTPTTNASINVTSIANFSENAVQIPNSTGTGVETIGVGNVSVAGVLSQCTRGINGSTVSSHSVGSSVTVVGVYLLNAITSTSSTSIVLSTPSINGSTMVIGGVLTIGSEQMIITSIGSIVSTGSTTGSAISVAIGVNRGVNGSTAATHLANSLVTYSTNPVTTDNPLTTSATTINLTNVINIVSGTIIQIGSEDILAGTVNGSTQLINCTRGFNGTSASSHNLDSVVTILGTSFTSTALVSSNPPPSSPPVPAVTVTLPLTQTNSASTAIKFRIETTGSSSKLFVNNVLACANSSGNPNTLLQPRFKITSSANTVQTMSLDYVYIRQDR